MKPNLLFFARAYQTDFYPVLESETYKSLYVTLTLSEKKALLKKGYEVVGCFEQEFQNSVSTELFLSDYLISSFVSDRFFGGFSAEKRNKILANEILFWSSLLDKFQPIAVVNELVALEIAEVLLIEARKRNIPYIAPMHSPIENYFYWIDNPIDISCKPIPINNIDVKTAMDIALQYLTMIKNDRIKPFYIKNLAKRINLRNILGNIRALLVSSIHESKILDRQKFIYEKDASVRIAKLSVTFKSMYLRYDELPSDDSYEYVFYPLHQEPEATLNYMSEFYSNQVSTIENILKCLKTNQILIVKEHPVDKGSLLKPHYRKLRKSYSNVLLLPAEVSAYDVIDRCSLIITLTSTAAWEAAIIGKPVIVMGKIFYVNCPGFYVCENFTKLREMIRVNKLHPPAFSDLHNFLGEIIMNSFKGNPFPHRHLYDEENIRNIVDSINCILGLKKSLVG